MVPVVANGFSQLTPKTQMRVNDSPLLALMMFYLMPCE